MALSSNKYEKPILPRTSDTSDLGSNRASVYSGKGLSFDGVNDVVSLGTQSSITEDGFTISLYAKLDDDTEHYIFTTGYASTNSLLLFSPSSSNEVRVSWYDGSTAPNTGGITYVNGEWFHVTVTYDGSTIKIFKNGEEVISQSYSISAIDEGLYELGWATQRNKSTAYLQGDLSDFKAFNTALTAAQVKELYDNPEQAVPTGVDTTSLVLHFPMTEGNGSYLYNANQGALGTELISNGGFDETCQKWGTTDSTDVEIVNGKAIWTNAPLSGSFVKQPLDLEIGKFYRVSFDYTSTAFNIFVNLGDTQQAVPLGNGRASFDMYYGSGDSSLSFQHGYLSASSATVDNVSVKEVVPTYITGTINGATWVSGLPEPLPQTALMDWNKYQYWTGSQMATIGSSTVTTVKHTFHARIRLDALNSDTNLGSMIFMNYAATGTIFSVTYQGKLQLRPHCSTNGSVNLVSGSVLNLGEVYDVVGVIDGTTAKIYLNGILDTSASHIQTTSPQGGGVIGSWSSTNLNTAFDGIIHEVSYFDRGLTGEEIGGLYQGTITPESLDGCIHRWTNLSNWQDQKGSTNATLTGTPEYVLVEEGHTSGIDAYKSDIYNPRASGAYNFDGSSWAQIQENSSLNIPATSNVTMEAWVYRMATPPDSYPKWIDCGSGTSTETNFSFGTLLQSDEVYVEWRTSSSGWIFTDTDCTFSKNEWNHFVVTIEMDGSNSSIKTYKNGSLFSTKSQTTTRGTGGNAHIGKPRWSASRTFVDQVSNARVYNYALTAEQVADNYNQKVSTFGGTKATSEMDAYIARTVAAGATVEAHSCVINYLTELDKK